MKSLKHPLQLITKNGSTSSSSDKQRISPTSASKNLNEMSTQQRRNSPGTSGLNSDNKDDGNLSDSQMNDGDDDDFQDAIDIDSAQLEMDLETALDEAKLAIKYFFNNKFDEARNLMEPYANVSMYHSVGACVFAFLEAILTFEHRHIQAASESLKRCLTVCNRYRRKNTITESLGKPFRKSNYEQFSEVEAHAELCSAEALLLKAMLTFIEDETLSSLIKGGIKIRNCFNSYKECAVLLKQRKWSSENSRAHFESGVLMGIGSFNLMISLLPARVIRLLEFIGFSGNKSEGLQDLIAGYKSTGIRQVLCVMQLLGYHLVVCFVLSHKEGDLVFCDEILNKQLKMYPEGAWFLFFKGRLEFMKGNLDEAIHWYKKSWRSQNVWAQFHHLCFWELLWVNSLKLDWREASVYATYLIEEGPMAHDQPTYASVPGIRVFGMMCVKPGYSVRKPSAQPPKRYQLQKPYYIPNSQNKYGIIKDNRPSSSLVGGGGGYQQQSSPIHDSYQLQHQANYQYLNRPDSSPIIGSGTNTHKDYSDIQINHFSPGNSGSVYGRNNEMKSSSIVAEDSSQDTALDTQKQQEKQKQENVENTTENDEISNEKYQENHENQQIREKRSLVSDFENYDDDLLPEFPWDKVMEFQSSVVWDE